MIIPQSSVRVEDYVAKLVEDRLSAGKVTKLDALDLAKLVRVGVCTVPSYIDLKSNESLCGYLGSVLIRFHPNSGSTKREKFGPRFRYEFIPKEVKT
jgi:hypothetical protein